LSQPEGFEFDWKIVDSGEVFQIEDVYREMAKKIEMAKELKITLMKVVSVDSKRHIGVVTHELGDPFQLGV